jgi:hypothetical protein
MSSNSEILPNHILCHCGNDEYALNMSIISLLLEKKTATNPFPQFLDSFEDDFVNKENLAGIYYCKSDLFDFCNFNKELGNYLSHADDCICSKKWGMFILE